MIPNRMPSPTRSKVILALACLVWLLPLTGCDESLVARGFTETIFHDVLPRYIRAAVY